MPLLRYAFFSLALLGVVAVAGMAMNSASPQPQDEAFQDDLTSANRLIDGAFANGYPARLDAGGKALDLIRKHAANNAEAAVLASMLDLSLQREDFKNRPLESFVDQIANAADDATREQAWRDFRNEIHDRTNHLLQGLDQGEIDANDARRLLEIAKYASEAVDDFQNIDPVTGGDSRLTKMIKLLNGIAAGTKGLENASAADLMEAFRDIVAGLTPRVDGSNIPHAVAVLEFPAAVSAAIIDHNRRGLEEITRTLDYLPAAMSGDPQALQGMLAGSRRVEQIITGQAYGRAIWNAMNDRIVDRIPFARTLAAWFGDRVNEELIGNWCGTWSTTWGDIDIYPDCQFVVLNGFFKRRGGTITPLYATENTLAGVWEFPQFGVRGIFEWEIVAPNSFEGIRQEEGHNPIRWDGVMLDDPRP